MAYSKVLVLGDSLVDSGNALKLANFYGGLPFTDLPDGAPYAADGYFAGRFSDGYTFADLISNKAVGAVTQPVFPYHFEDPWLGLPIDPLASDPKGVAINFAYGGAQIIQGGEVVPDLDGQTDALKDTVDGRIDPTTLLLVTIGGNDVRSLAPGGSAPASDAEAFADLDAAAAKLQGELGGLISRGARHILITGIPDVGMIPRYDDNGNGVLDGLEVTRAAAATRFSAYLDNLIATQVVPALRALGANVTYVPVADRPAGTGIEQGALSAIMPTLAALHGLTTTELKSNLLKHQELLFFDEVHPTGQVHALIGAYMNARLNGTAWIETLPIAAAEVDFRAAGSISVAGEVDTLTVLLAAGTDYRFDLLGMSSLGTFGSLADPYIRLLTPSGAPAAFDDDSGAGFDATITVTAATAGSYSVQIGAIGAVTGNYTLIAAVLGGAAMTEGNAYVVASASTLVIEGAGGAGIDVVRSSVSYALPERSEIEELRTTDINGRGAINLTGNEFAQLLVGNAGDNRLDGRGGADTYQGGGGKDVFVLGADALANPAAADRITDYARGDVVDATGLLSVAAGTNVAAGGYARVTTSGLIQIDLDGGGNNWLTVATINSAKGAVSFRYLSGGTPTTVELARVADSQAKAAGAAGSSAVTTSALAAGAMLVSFDSSTIGAAQPTTLGDLALATGFESGLSLTVAQPIPLPASPLAEWALSLPLSLTGNALAPLDLSGLPASVSGGSLVSPAPLDLPSGTELAGQPMPAPAAITAFAAIPVEALAGLVAAPEPLDALLDALPFVGDRNEPGENPVLQTLAVIPELVDPGWAALSSLPILADPIDPLAAATI